MYPEHFELLPFVKANLPVELELVSLDPQIKKAYRVFYDYLDTFLNYHDAKAPWQSNRTQIMRRRIGMKEA